MIDFGKITMGNAVDTILPPREIFNALPKKNAAKFQYPRDVQSQVWAKWFDLRNQESSIIKMNTGSGKTVVGLLILKSCLNENKSPAVYICPDKYLVRQVIDAADEIGIEVTDDARSHRFLSGKAILVANIYKLVNGKSVFGVGDEGCKIKISSLLIDDAHACIETIEEQFSIKVPNTSDAYQQIFSLLKTSLLEQCESKAIEIESGDISSYLHVSYWAWQANHAQILRILSNHSSDEFLLFKWPLLKEFLKLCNCVISGNDIEISPYSIPLHVVPSIQGADRKIFMTATLLDDSILSTHFGIDESSITSAIFPDSAGDVGDRMILLPQVINTEISDDETKSFCKEVSKTHNVVVIVPSGPRASFWRDSADLILSTENLYDGIEMLKSGHVGLTILLNRYDGVDLPGDACRMLVIDGLPDVRKKIDKIDQVVLMGATRGINKIMQRIEQGMGRGVRSNDDYCAVLLTGHTLTSILYSEGTINKFSPATKAQFDLSEQVARQIHGKTYKEIMDTIELCFSRNQQWVSTSKGALASLKYSEAQDIDKVSVQMRRSYDEALNNNYTKSFYILNTLLSTINNKIEKGYIKQITASYINLYDQVEAQRMQKSAIDDNRRVLKPIAGIEYHKISGTTYDQAVACSRFLTEKYRDPNMLIVDVNRLTENLQFKEDSSNIFEESFKMLARYIGLESQRPELEYKKGPDVLWHLENASFLVIECKNEATSGTISKDYCNQLNGSAVWFENKYGRSTPFTPILVHTSKMFEYASSPLPETKIINGDGLNRFIESFKNFIKSLAANNELGNSPAIREKLIAYRLRGSDIANNYTSNFSVRNTAN